MSVGVVGFTLVTLLSWVLLLTAWRRNLDIAHRLTEPALVNTELLRLMADTHAAARGLAHPQRTINGEESHPAHALRSCRSSARISSIAAS